MSVALIVVGAALVVVWLGIVAMATPTVGYRFGRRLDLPSHEFEAAVSLALATMVVVGNTVTRLEVDIPACRRGGIFHGAREFHAIGAGEIL